MDDPADGAGKKVTDLVPPAYLAKVTSNGMQVYEGTTPPQLEGKFKMSPVRFDYSSWREPNTYPAPGTTMTYDITFQLSDQQTDQSIAVNLPGFYMGENVSNMFITGSGNNFTICFKSTMVGGPSALFSYPYAHIFSGTIDGGLVKNVKMAIVGLDGTNSSGMSVAGNVDLYSDKDGVCEKIP